MCEADNLANFTYHDCGIVGLDLWHEIKTMLQFFFVSVVIGLSWLVVRVRCDIRQTMCHSSIYLWLHSTICFPHPRVSKENSSIIPRGDWATSQSASSILNSRGVNMGVWLHSSLPWFTLQDHKIQKLGCSTTQKRFVELVDMWKHNITWLSSCIGILQFNEVEHYKAAQSKTLRGNNEQVTLVFVLHTTPMRTLLLWMLPAVSFALSDTGLAAKVKDDLSDELEKTTCPSQTGSKVFKYTGKDQVFTFPSGITELRVRLAFRRFPPVATVYLNSNLMHSASQSCEFLRVLSFLYKYFFSCEADSSIWCSFVRAGVSFWSRWRRWWNQ